MNNENILLVGGFILTLTLGILGVFCCSRNTESAFDGCAREIGMDACITIQHPNQDQSWKSAYAKCITALGYDDCDFLRRSIQ